MLVFVSSAQFTGVADLGLSGQVVYKRRYCGHTRDLTVYTCAPGCIMMRSRAREGSDEEQQHGTEPLTIQFKGQLSERLPPRLPPPTSGPSVVSDRHQTTYLGFWGEEGLAETVHVAQVDLDAGVGESELVEAGGAVTGTDVTLTREGRDGDGVLQLRLGQVVADPTINVALSTETRQTAAF